MTARLHILLNDGAGSTSPVLAPLVAQLRAERPDSVLGWPARPRTAALLTALATGELALTHEALHTWPHPNAVRHLRHRLIVCRLLPPVDRNLLDTEGWLHRRLTGVADHPHERLLRRFALWHQLPRVRADAATRPLRASAKQYVTQQFTQAQVFLTWLHQRGIEPAATTQTDVDTWYATHRVHQRHNVRGFLLWATQHHHLPPHLAVPRVAFAPGAALTQQRRLALLRRYLDDDTAPAPARAAAVLLLLYAQPLSRIQRLTRDDLFDVDGEPHLRLGDPPSPLPLAVAQLLSRLIADEHSHGSQWLFPGRLPGQPAAYGTLHRWLRELEFPLIEARISALRQLVLQAPAPVIADALGFHQTTTARQHAHAGAPWNRYPTSR